MSWVLYGWLSSKHASPFITGGRPWNCRDINSVLVWGHLSRRWASAGEGADLLSAWSQSHGVWQIPRKTVLRGQLIPTLQAPWAQPSWTWLARAWRVCAVFDMKHQINTVNVLPRRIMVATLKEFFFCRQVSFYVEPGAILDKSQTQGMPGTLLWDLTCFLGKRQPRCDLV